MTRSRFAFATAVIGLAGPWILACERLHGGAPRALALLLALPWLALVVAFRATLPSGRATTARLAATLLATDLVFALVDPARRLVAGAAWEAARVALVFAGGEIAARLSPAPLAIRRASSRRGLGAPSALGAVGALGALGARGARILALGVVAIELATMTLLAFDGPRDESAASRVDAMLVLGLALEPDGRPTPSLVARVDRAAELAKRDDVRFVVVSGGVPRAGRTEADAMRELLVARGVAEERIVVDRAARSTIENFACAAPLLRAGGASRVLLVTEPWHMTRAAMLARRHAPGATFVRAPASSASWNDPRRAAYLLVREAGGILEELLLPSTPRPARCPSP